MEVAVESNALEVMRDLDDLGRKQLPFALATTLTKVAQVSVERKHKQLPSLFMVRSKGVARGITMTRAEKKEWPNTQSVVGSRDEFMVLQEIGGLKRPGSGSNVAIPTKAIQRTASGRVRASQKPKAILSKKSGSLAKAGGKPVIRRKVTKRNNLGIMFLLRPSTRIKPRLGLRVTVERVVAQELGKTFERSLDQALASAKS